MTDNRRKHAKALLAFVGGLYGTLSDTERKVIETVNSQGDAKDEIKSKSSNPTTKV